MPIPQKAYEAAVQALFEDGCGEPKVDAATVLEAAYKIIAAQTLRHFDEFARNEHDRTGRSSTVFNGGFGYALRLVGERADALDLP